MTGAVVSATVGPGMVDPGALAASVTRASTGAIVTFTGQVRDHDHGRGVTLLAYEAHPDAEDFLRNLAEEWIAGNKDVTAVAVAHRTGELHIGDIAFAVAVSSSHRREAFRACGDLVDRVKAELPVWKHEVFDDGTDEWVNAP